MREMRESGIEWLEDIPSHWKVMPNKRVMKKKKEICPQYQGEDILSLTMNGVIVRDLNAGGKMPATFDGYQRLTAGNLLMCLFDIDVTPRCIGLIKNTGLSSPAYSQFVVNEKGYAPYYYYYYLNLDHTKELLHMAKNLRHSLTEDQLGEIGVAVPPYAEQVQIVEALERKLPKVDTLIANVQAQIEKLKAYKQSLITEVVTKGLDPAVPMKDSGIEWIGDMPEHWQLIRFKDKYVNVKEVAKEKSAEYERLALTLNGVVKRPKDDAEGLQPKEFDGYQILRENDFIFKMIDLQNISTSRVGLSSYTGLVSPAYIRFSPKNENQYNQFVYYYLMSMYYNCVYNNLGGNGVRSALNASDMGNFLIPYPDDTEQKIISALLDKKCKKIDRLIAIKQAKIEKLEQYKKSLIYEYVTGKKEVH